MVTQPRHAPLGLGAPLVVAASATLACVAIWAGDPTTPGGPLPICPTKALLGIDCPGCGSLRMLYSLMHGNVLAAARFNALALAALVLLVWAPMVTLCLVSTWFVVRNIPFAPFNWLYV